MDATERKQSTDDLAAALAAAVPRDPVNTGREEYGSMSIWFERSDEGEWRWEVEFYAVDAARNTAGYGATLAEALTQVAPRVLGEAPPDELCEAVLGSFVFGAQTCMSPSVTRVQCPDPDCRDEPHTHAACGLHVWARGTSDHALAALRQRLS